MSNDDPQFIDQLRKGDREAFGLLVKRHHNALLATARSMLSQADAEEAVQDAWISAHRAIGKFQGNSQIKTWLTRIVINQSRMMLRKQGREITMGDANSEHPLAHRFHDRGGWSQPPQQWVLDGPDNVLTRDELRHCLQTHLQDMPEMQRLVLELRDLQGLPADDVCNLLDISASNVRVALHRARARLFDMVDHFQETGTC